jgi:hypothetical protein
MSTTARRCVAAKAHVGLSVRVSPLTQQSCPDCDFKNFSREIISCVTALVETYNIDDLHWSIIFMILNHKKLSNRIFNDFNIHELTFTFFTIIKRILCCINICIINHGEMLKERKNVRKGMIEYIYRSLIIKINLLGNMSVRKDQVYSHW